MNSGVVIFSTAVFPGLVFILLSSSVCLWLEHKIYSLLIGKNISRTSSLFELQNNQKDCRQPLRALQLVITVLGFSGACLAALLVWHSIVFVSGKAIADMLVILIILITTPILFIFRAHLNNLEDFNSLIANKIFLRIAAFEPAFILSCLVPLIHTKDLSLHAILEAPAAIAKISGIIAFLTVSFCATIKLSVIASTLDEEQHKYRHIFRSLFSPGTVGYLLICRSVMFFAMWGFIGALFTEGFSPVDRPAELLIGISGYGVVFILLVVLRRLSLFLKTEKQLWKISALLFFTSLVNVFIALKGY